MFRSLFFVLFFMRVATAQDLMNLASGTSENPQSGSLPMLMQNHACWSLMWMGQGFILDTQETGPRGADKFYSTNWGMLGATHELAGGTVQFDLMLSLGPRLTKRRYPELFQTGETAYGRPIVDGQHPHDFIMAVGVHYVHPLWKDATLSCISRLWAIRRSGPWRFRIVRRHRSSRKRRCRIIGRIPRTSRTKLSRLGSSMSRCG